MDWLDHKAVVYWCNWSMKSEHCHLWVCQIWRLRCKLWISPVLISKQRRGFLKEISTLHRVERVKSSLMNMMQDDQSRSSNYAVATVPAISLLMPLADCLSLNRREREGKSSSEGKVTWWGDCFPRHINDIWVPGSYLKPQIGVLCCNFGCMAFTELEVVVQEIHWGPGLILQEGLLGMFGALTLAVHWFRTKSFVSHCEPLIFSS